MSFKQLTISRDVMQMVAPNLILAAFQVPTHLLVERNLSILKPKQGSINITLSCQATKLSHFYQPIFQKPNYYMDAILLRFISK